MRFLNVTPLFCSARKRQRDGGVQTKKAYPAQHVVGESFQPYIYAVEDEYQSGNRFNGGHHIAQEIII